MVPASARHRWLSTLPLVVGAGLFIATLRYVDVPQAANAVLQLGPAAPVIVLTSGLWHLFRTLAWAQSFGASRVAPFGRLFRVRLAADAISYLTVSGVGGEPIKILMLHEAARPRDVAAAIVLERIMYFVVTLSVMACGAVAATQLLALAPLWIAVFRAIAICAAALVLGAIVAILSRGAWLRGVVGAVDRACGTLLAQRRAVRATAEFLDRVTVPLDRDEWRLARLVLLEAACFACHTTEAWVVMRALGVPVSVVAALAMEVFARGINLAFAFVPGNLGTLEASSVAIVAALGSTTTVGAALAIVRRLRGLAWAGAGLLVYPRHTIVPELIGRDSSTPVL